MFLKLLREAFAQNARNRKISREIEEGENLQKALPDSIEADVKLQLDSRWWLERFFKKHNLSLVQGILLIYAIVETPRLLMLPILFSKAPESFATAYASSLFTEMFIPITLLLINSVYRSLVKLKRNTNRILREKEFVTPPILLSNKEQTSRDSLAELDKEYGNRYIKPVMLKTLQYGLDLSFDKNYQLGFGLIATSMVVIFLFARFVLKVLPYSLFAIADPRVPELTIAYVAYTIFIIGFDWFIVGMATFTLFVAFLTSIQASGNTVRIRSFESIKESFTPATTLVLKTSFTATFLIAWLSPFMLIWSVLPLDPLVRQSARIFVESMLLIMVPIIIVSLLVPILKIHRGMVDSRERILLLKKHQLDDIEKFRETDTDKYFLVRQHLIQDYKDAQSNPVWVLNIPQMLEVVSTVLLPIVTFLISITI